MFIQSAEPSWPVSLLTGVVFPLVRLHIPLWTAALEVQISQSCLAFASPRQLDLGTLMRGSAKVSLPFLELIVEGGRFSQAAYG